MSKTKTPPPFESKVNSTYGAPMGRQSDHYVEGKLNLQRVPLYDGGYDKGGAYWGYERYETLYCAWNEDYTTYLRAPSRNSAKIKLSQDHLDVTFYR